jgi:16S rRNA (cytosine967-C5)-methyltransferase
MTRTSVMTARAAAVFMIETVLDGGMPLSEANPSHLPDPADRARAQRLALGTLRNLSQIDRLLKPFLARAPLPRIRHILRLAVWEMTEAGAAAHGIVNEAVALAQSDGRTTRQSGLVNAVLRKLPPAPIKLVGENRLPDWLRQRLIAGYDRRRVEAMERAWSVPPPIDLTLRNPGEAIDHPQAVTLPNGSVRLPGNANFTSLPGFAEGRFWAQDAAAAMAVPMLGDVAGRKVLDLCAAPGGKTMQLAALGAEVTALDLSDKRAGRLRDNLTRTGLSAEVVIADALEWEPGREFDAILLDAPCSATGTIRRHPDLPLALHPEAPDDLAGLQAELLDRALGWLAPGGRLVYAVCSLLPEEGENQITQALARWPNLTVIPPALPWADASWVTPEGGLRLTPEIWRDLGGMDGFYMAALAFSDEESPGK